MSEDRTKETKDPRSFEERVFARFDAIDERFGRFEERVEGRFTAVEIRITKLEARQLDTKPIWERALAEIAELNRAIREQSSEFQTGIDSLRTDLRSEFQTGIDGLRTDLRSEFQTGIDGLRTDLRSEFQTGIDGLRTEMKAEFASVRHKMEHELRGVARKIDALNQNLFEIRADQLYVDRRLEELETQIDRT